MVRFSVVVCTYNRSTLLKKCLEKLSHFIPSEENLFEILIINNNSNDDTEEISIEFVKRFAFIKYFIEKNPGLSNARNFGLKKSKGEYIIYIDDDAFIRSNFFDRIIEISSNYSFDAWGGIDIPYYLKVKPLWIKDQYFYSRLPFKRVSEIKSDDLFISGFCMVFKKSVLIEAGGFNPKLGMKGNTTAYGEETNLQIIIRKLGYSIGYDPKLVVDHYIHDYKLSFDWFFKSAFATGRDWIITYGLRKSNYEIFRNLVIGFGITFLKMPIGIIKLVFYKNYHIENFLIDIFRKLIKRFSIVLHLLK